MSNIDTLIRLIPLFPLLAALLTAALGPRILKQLSHWPVVLAIAGSCVLSLGLLRSVNELDVDRLIEDEGFEHVVSIWKWVHIEDAEPAPPHFLSEPGVENPAFSIDVSLRADSLTAIMLVMVTFISTLVAVYSIGYMKNDPGYSRFFTYIGLFVFSMNMLVLASNFVLLYVFWEAVGICSYLLIGFWYQKPSATEAGKKAFLVNRVGDFGFVLGLFLIWVTYGTLNFHDSEGVVGIFGLERLQMGHSAAYVGGAVGTAIGLLLLLGACGKSAQFPLHIWLPDAMEGPTPVSALIHAATMVTAGVYMIARCTPLFFASPVAQEVVAVVGVFTALLAALIALTQYDLKRVLAYSTISQLGYMFLALGCGSTIGVIAALFHLFTHAFFKSLLFLGSGSVMHAMGNVIDMRRFGGLRNLMPITCITFLIGCLALAGVPPLSGFWSKDMVMAAIQDRASKGASGTLFQVLFWIASFTSFLTAFYIFRAFIKTFYGEQRVPPEAGDHAHESPWSMTIPLLILAVFAAAIGGVMELSHWFVDFLVRTPSLAFDKLEKTTSPALNAGIAMLGTLVGFSSIGLAAFFYLGSTKQVDRIAEWLGPIYRVSHLKFLFDEIYYWTVVVPMRALAAFCYFLDRYLVDGLVNLAGALPPFLGRQLRQLQRGLVQSYALAMMIGVLILLAALLFGRASGAVTNPARWDRAVEESPNEDSVRCSQVERWGSQVEGLR